MRVRNSAWMALAALLAFSVQARATTISYVGYVEGTQATDWRTASTAKTLDIDGNDVYGSLGGANWNNEGKFASSSTELGWGYVNVVGNQVAGGADYSQVDKLDGSSKIPAGIVYFAPAYTFVLTGVAADFTGRTIRVGIMEDCGSSGQSPNDTFKGLQITQTVGGAADSSVVALRNGAAGDTVPEMYFFDIVGATAGDQFTVYGLNNVNGSSNNDAYFGPISVDISPVPEPSSVASLAAGLIGLLAYAWRKRK